MKWNVSGSFDREGFRIRVEPRTPEGGAAGGVRETSIIPAQGAPNWLIPLLIGGAIIFLIR